MADWTDCPNECGERVKATWHNVDASWDAPEGQRPYTTPQTGDYHLAYACRGSFNSGAAVAFGLMGMAEAIRRIEAVVEPATVRFLGVAHERIEIGAAVEIDLNTENGRMVVRPANGAYE